MKTLNDSILAGFNSDNVTADYWMGRLNKALGKRLGAKYKKILNEHDPFAYSEKKIVNLCLEEIPTWDDLSDEQKDNAVFLTKEWVAQACYEYKAGFKAKLPRSH